MCKFPSSDRYSIAYYGKVCPIDIKGKGTAIKSTLHKKCAWRIEGLSPSLPLTNRDLDPRIRNLELRIQNPYWGDGEWNAILCFDGENVNQWLRFYYKLLAPVLSINGSEVNLYSYRRMYNKNPAEVATSVVEP